MLGAMIAALFACCLVAGTDVAAAGEQICRQLEAELAAASLAAGNSATVRARLLASLEAHGCRDGSELQQEVVPPMEDADQNP